MMKLFRQGWDGSTPAITHSELVNCAFRYLTLIDKHTVAFKERVGSTSENPDAIGFCCNGATTLIECKASRSDFHADKKKFFRREPKVGMGYKRYMMAPVGMLQPDEMPDGWGLIEVYPKARIYRKMDVANYSRAFIERNTRAETSYLVSAIRRINISMCVFVEPVNPS